MIQLAGSNADPFHTTWPRGIRVAGGHREITYGPTEKGDGAFAALLGINRAAKR